MINDSVFLEGSMTRIISVHTVIIGGGLAGLSTALSLYEQGIRDIVILVDSKEGSTSKYAMSDHQSYYKLADFGSESDSPYRMARTLTLSGNMDGDVALVESTLSSRCFYKLLEMGIPFERDAYGAFYSAEAISGKERRQVSAGTDTCRQILSALELRVKEKGIPVYDNYQAIRLITDDDKKKAVGVLALNRTGIRERHQRFVLFNSVNVVLATGGPGGLFFHEGYPRSHYGSLGMALEAGIKGKNLAEFTFGICAVRRSLMMNGAFQSAVPRYVSTNESGGDIQEFLLPYFNSPDELYALQRIKGRQWEFDVKKVRSDGPSLIDLLVYDEIVVKGRHVFMDYRENPQGLAKEGEDIGLPFERLRSLSMEAYSALLDQDLDPSEQPVEVYPSMIHMNGGLGIDIHFETSVKGAYAVGEIAGSHGSELPPGASVNQTQVSALRSSEHIARERSGEPLTALDSFVAFARGELHHCTEMADQFLSALDSEDSLTEQEPLNIRAARLMIGKRMDKTCAMYHDRENLVAELERAQQTMNQLSMVFRPTTQMDLCQLYEIEDLLTAQIAILKCMLNEMDITSASRGSHMVHDPQGTLASPLLDERYRFSVSERETAGKTQEAVYDRACGEVRIEWRESRQIPR